jgi:ADP-ribosyltransferase exoenzyme
MKTLQAILSEGPLEEIQHKKMATHYSNYSGEHKKVLDDYSEDSSSMNSTLWSRHKGKPYQMGEEYHKKDFEHMDSAMAAHETPEDMTVHSGTMHDPRKMKDSEGIIHHPAYMSTSLDLHIAHGFAHTQAINESSNDMHLLHIKVPAGSKGAYVGHLGVANPSEREFVLPKDSKLKYHRSDVEYNGFHKNDNTFDVYHHHMSVE